MKYSPKPGLNVPAITVTDADGNVIPDEQRRVFRHLVQQGYGADVIFGVGTTGEWNRLSNSERQKVIEIEIDEIRRINEDLKVQEQPAVEAWVGVNGSTKAEVLANLDLAIQLRADAAVIAPLAISDLTETETVRFFQHDLTNLIETSRRELPILLYDNADIAASGRESHIRTRTVKELSRLEWIAGIKVSAPRHVLGNYTKAALHFKKPGEFGIFIGDAMLIFELFRPSRGLLGRLREGWRDYLLHDALPIGVVSGPGNILPREWQKSWRACWAGDEESMNFWQTVCQEFEEISGFEEGGQTVKKSIACLKYALEVDGVITSSAVAPGTKSLSETQKEKFKTDYQRLKQRIAQQSAPMWCTRAV
ncbi:MAG: dihydrodipicolinate synthase family protein [Acidobacteriota bacterium]